MHRRSTLVAILATLVMTVPGIAEVTVEEVKQAVLKELQHDQPKASANPNVFNPAMGLVLDTAFQDTSSGRSEFKFRSAELNISAAVDPYAKIFSVINGTPDGVEVEETFFMTTALPGNLTVRGGRMFANFGRLPHWHDHELPFVDRTPSLERFFDGEAQADGIEIMHLFKTPFFLQGTAGAYRKLGADNNRLEQTDGRGNGQSAGRPLNAMTYLSRLFSFIPLGDDYGVDIGASEALTPKQYYINGVRVDNLNSARSVTGIDITFRYEPLANNVYRKLIWGTELFRNDERREQALALDSNGDGIGDTNTYERRHALGGYSYVDWRFAPQWSTVAFYDAVQDFDTRQILTTTFGTSLAFHVSEFQRIRLQLSQKRVNDGSPLDNQLFLQWFGTIGNHVHIFKDR